MSIVGFDFGTTNSVMSFVRGERCIPVLDDGFPHPSVVSYRGGKTVVGRKAREELVSATSAAIEQVVRSPKTLLGNASVTVGGFTYSPREVVRDVVAYVRMHAEADRAARAAGADFTKAVVTIPVDMTGPRRRELRDACRMAGVSIYQFVHEPLAALYGHLRGLDDFATQVLRLNRELMLVFDWGGGTLDLTLCQLKDGMLVQILSSGRSDVGGDYIDDLLVNAIEKRELERRGVVDEVSIQPHARARLRAAAERAKIRLSDADTAQVLVTDYFDDSLGDVDLEMRLTRRDLEEVVDSTIQKGIGQIHSLLRRAGVEPAAVRMCLATGGMANMPLIRTRLHEIFGAARVHVSKRSNTVISEGAAWIAHDDVRLVLAKNIEVAVGRCDYFPVLHAGTPLPREGDIQESDNALTLYCNDPSDGIAKFELVAPMRTGRQVQRTDERDTLALLRVKVDSGKKPLLERLTLAVAIDENLILTAEAGSTIRGDSDRTEIHELEFGLHVPTPDDKPKNERPVENLSKSKHPPGTIRLRRNLSEHANDWKSVPGEVLYRWDSNYFDRRSDPPEDQAAEKDAYQRCSGCMKVYCICACLRDARSGAARADGLEPPQA